MVMVYFITYINRPIDSLYTVESVKYTVPVTERIFRQKIRDSGKNFACFRVMFFFLCHSFQLITLVHVLCHQTAKCVCGSIREAFVLDESCKEKRLNSMHFIL